MRTSNWNRRWMKVSLISVALFALMSVGCGGADQSSNPAGTAPGSVYQPGLGWSTGNNCPAGTFGLNGLPCAAYSTFASACWYQAGGSVTPVNGVEYCRYELRRTTGFGMNAASFGVLAPGTPMGGFYTGIQLRRGDKLRYTGTGAWGVTQLDCKEKWIFEYCTTSSNSCSQNPLDGAYGLMGSDGVEVFPLGREIPAEASKLVNNDGVLRIGFNIPAGTVNYCGGVSADFFVLRCEDAQGRSYPCP